MVCYGPSTGCRNCRQRKIKCDEQRPTCGQCTKSKKLCLGYDRTAGVAFRDETRTTEKRAAGRERQKSASASADAGDSFSSESRRQSQKPDGLVESSSALVQSQITTEPVRTFGLVEDEDINFSSFGEATTFETPAWATINQDLQQYRPGRVDSHLSTEWEVVPFGLPQDPEQQSICFFMSKFVMDDRKEEIWGGSLEALPSVYHETGSKSALSLATTATSMSSIAWNPECANFRPVALKKYVQSLKMITDAVQDPVESQSDSTLMAVLMLGFYENIKSLTLQKSSRESHTKGAVALITARSPESFHNPTSLRLYLAVRAQLLSHCINNADPKPLDDFLTATADAVPDGYVPTCADQLVLLAMDVPRLGQREQDLLQEANAVSKQSKAKELLQETKKCEESIAAWSYHLPDAFQYTRLPLDNEYSSKAQNSYPCSMDIYRDSTVASTWNTWRNTRIKLLQIVMKCATILQPPGSRTPSSEYKRAVDTINQLVNGICSSIPFHLGHHKKNVASPGFSDYPHAPGQAKWPENFAATGAVGGWLMMPQLAAASKVDTIPNSQRQWMLEYLTTFMRDPRDMNKGLTDDDAIDDGDGDGDGKVDDDEIRVMIHNARVSQEIPWTNACNHPVRKYYQFRAALAAELQRYSSKPKTGFGVTNLKRRHGERGSASPFEETSHVRRRASSPQRTSGLKRARIKREVTS